ncbi:GntR family transcriptional regulator [Saccharomonospora sp. NPDC006951]
MTGTTSSGGQKLSKSETVYRQLRDNIMAGRYVAGYRLVLDQLAREHSVSTVPVREAIRRLEAEGLVTFTRNVGAEVAGINTSDYADTMQTLAFLEGAATSLGARQLTPDQLREAAELNDAMRTLLSGEFDPVRFTQLNEQFHQTLCSACPNQHLLDVLGQEWQRMSFVRRSSFTFMPSRTEASVREHDELLTLIRSGAPEAEIEWATRRHKLHTVDAYLAARNTPTVQTTS